MNILKNREIILWGLAYLLFIFILLIESMIFPGFWTKHLGLPVTIWHFVVIGTVTQWLITKRIQVDLTRYISNILFSLVIISNLISISFFFLESTHYPNYVFSTFHIHHVSFISIPIFNWLTWLVINLHSKIKKIFQLWAIALSIYPAILLLRLANPTLFELIGSEDHFIEWLGVLALLVACTFSIKQLISLNHESIWKKITLIFLAVVTIFMAGEEVSWGQRLFNLETPKPLSGANLQGEITLHNIGYIQDKMFYAYLLIGSFGSFGWILKQKIDEMNILGSSRFLKVIKDLSYFIPNKATSVFFMPIFIYSLMRVTTGSINYKTWEETAELFLFTGLALSLSKWGHDNN